LSELVSQQAILVALGGAVALLVLLRLLSAGGVGGAARRRARREARRLLADGQTTRAGDLFLEAGDKDAALDVFLKGGLLGKAAPLLEEKGDDRAAAEAFEAAREFKRAGKAWGKLGDHLRAAENYQSGEAYPEAARHWQAAGEVTHAGNAWWQAEEYERAAQTYRKAGLLNEAGKAYRYLLDQALSDVSLVEPDEGDTKQRVADLARASGKAYAKGGDLAAAAEVLLLADLKQDAVPVLEQAGRYTEAAKLEYEGRRLERAADLFERAGEERRAATVRAKVALEDDRPGDAAALLEAVGDRRRAAALWSKAKEPSRAAALHEQREDWRSAAKYWARAKEPARAARAWEKAGARERAAEVYRTQGDLKSELRIRMALHERLRAAEILLEAGEPGQAEDILKEIESPAEDHRRACLLLADLYRERGQASAAAVRYRQALAGTQPRRKTAETWYHFGRCAEEAGELDVAEDALRALRELDPTYEDVDERLKAVVALRRPEPEPEPEPDPLPAPRSELAPGSDLDAGLEATEAMLTSDFRPPSEVVAARYERMGTLGSGGTAAVYRARDTVLDREVALKVLVRRPGDEISAPDRFLREARSAAKLSHPNIVTIFDFGEEDGDLYIAMELVEGLTLRQMVKDGGALGLPLIRSIVTQVCDALAYAHGRSLVHRDIKPANLMWTGGERLKIADFGLAKAVREDSGYTLMSRVLGTPYYMSPEQIEGEAIDHRTDIYSVGVTLYELSTARVPFGRGDVLKAHMHQPPEPPSSFRDDMPEWLERIIMRSLSKVPDDRYPNAEAMRAEIPGVR